MPQYEIEVTRGRKLCRDYQSHEAAIRISQVVEVPEPSEDAEPAYDGLRNAINDLWRVANEELDEQVANLRMQAEAEATALPATPPTGNRPAPALNRPAPAAAPTAPKPAFRPPPTGNRPAAPAAPSRQNRDPLTDLPREGKQVFPWVKKLEDLFGVELLKPLTNAAKESGASTRTGDWSPEMAAWAGETVLAMLQEGGHI